MKHSKSGLFLMEMIMCILFFSLSAALCAQMFAKSHVISEQNIENNHAIILCENFAETYYAEFGDIEKIGNLFYPNSYELSEQGMNIYYDSNYQITTDKSSAFILSIKRTSSSSKMNEAVITLSPNSEEESAAIYTLKVSVNNPNHPS